MTSLKLLKQNFIKELESGKYSIHEKNNIRKVFNSIVLHGGGGNDIKFSFSGKTKAEILKQLDKLQGLMGKHLPKFYCPEIGMDVTQKELIIMCKILKISTKKFETLTTVELLKIIKENSITQKQMLDRADYEQNRTMFQRLPIVGRRSYNKQKRQNKRK